MTSVAIPAPARAVDTRTVAFWVMVACSAWGLWTTVKSLVPQMRAYPASAGIDLVFLVVTGALGLWLVRRLLRPVQAPPWSGTWLALMWGGLAACAIALTLNTMLISAWSRALDLETAAAQSAAYTAPINEELAKAAGLFLLAAVSTRLVRGAADGFVYGALIGLGFQLFENLSYGFIQVVVSGGVDPANATAQALFVRFFLTGIGSHWAMTAVAGAGIGYLVGAAGRPIAGRVWAAVGSLLLAMGMHWFFDSPVLEGFMEPIGKPLIGFVVTLVVFLAVRRRFRARWEAVSEEEVAAGVLDEEESRALSRRRSRKRALRRLPAGPEREAAAALQGAQLELLENRVADPEAEVGPSREAALASRHG